MKKLLSAFLCAALLCAFAGCAQSEPAEVQTQSYPQTASDEMKMETVLTPAEYVLYQNIFYNDQGDDYVGQTVTKTGIFTVLQDAYNDTRRFYVWGYNDNTKCCDWQWEFVPAADAQLPEPGSKVQVYGTFVQDESALDGYWIENAELTVMSPFKGGDADVDTTTMGGTLERVQLANLQGHPEQFEGKSVKVYGRIESPTSVQHPYYDNCFSQPFASDGAVQAVGARVVVSGVYANGVITQADVTLSNDF